jgi:chromosomal replication initiation ATPase DnaA
MTDEQIKILKSGPVFNVVVDTVIAKLKEKYFLVEKTFDPTFRFQKAESQKQFVMNVIGLTCEYFGIKIAVLKSRHRGRSGNTEHSLVKIRAVVIKLSRELPEEQIPLGIIGDCIGRDHATGTHAIKMFDSYLKSIEFKYDYEQIKKKVNESLKMY